MKNFTEIEKKQVFTCFIGNNVYSPNEIMWILFNKIPLNKIKDIIEQLVKDWIIYSDKLWYSRKSYFVVDKMGFRHLEAWEKIEKKITFKDFWKQLNWQCRCSLCKIQTWASMAYEWSDNKVYCWVCKDKIEIKNKFWQNKKKV